MYDCFCLICMIGESKKPHYQGSVYWKCPSTSIPSTSSWKKVEQLDNPLSSSENSIQITELASLLYHHELENLLMRKTPLTFTLPPDHCFHDLLYVPFIFDA